MQRELIISSLVQRLRQRSNFALVLLLGGMFCLLRLSMGGPPPSFAQFLLPFVLVAAHLCFAPMPWQWTASDEARAPLGRGLFQALGFNLLWLTLLLLTISAFETRPQGPPHFPGPPPPDGAFHDPRLGFFFLNLGLAMAFGWIIAEKEAMALREHQTFDLLRRSEARALQNQLEPHVLFNALNSLAELVYEDPLAAEEVITRLAELYRMLSRHGKSDWVSLGEERCLVEAYLAMEQMRLGERLRVHWHWPDWADALRLPPLLLQPLVENAIKHGISPSDAGGELDISCQQDGNLIRLQVANTGQPLREAAPHGIGLGNLEARLALWPDAAASLHLEGRETHTLATLQWRHQ